MFRMAQPYFGLRGGWLTFWITLACGADMTLYGYDQGVFSGVVISQDFLQLHDLQGPSKTTLLGTVTAIYDVGCCIGSLFAYWLGEQMGRRNTVLLGTIVMSIGALLQVSSYSLGQMITGRVITGIGNGLNTSTAPIWQVETSKVQLRGKLVILENVLVLVGFSLANWLNYGLSFASGPVSWRFPLSFQFVFNIILFFTVPWLPESPRWLISHGRENEAEQIIADLEDKDSSDAFIQLQMSEIRHSVEYERANSVSFRDILRGRAHEKAGTNTVRRLILGMGAQAMQQFSGINVTSYYLPTVLTKSVGLEESLARLLTACNSVQYLLFSMIAIPNVERWGRRMLMMFGAAGMCFCYILITALIRCNEMPGYAHPHEVASASVAFFFLYYVFFGIGMQGVPWLYPTEINSLTMRTKGAALGAATNWIFNFMVVEITPTGIQNLGWRFYIIWIVLNAVMVPVIYVFYPETAGRTLEDMDSYYRGNPPLLACLDKEAISRKRPERYLARDEHIIRAKEGNEMVQHLETMEHGEA
ncbi:general substrate transporter [Penicillium alfredii]|uniref:General substrate transporter n=1 Tax=Penicillium alfredii TaxID=1506179 RepID=A0A9W9EGS4_9EURO|nr:general substrate transporter [Penicillium alfredii]KAJ5081528.1 general substrate transporter [Penicillium alfredii]